MHQPLDILTFATKQNIIHEQLELLQEKEQLIPGTVQYVVKRYKKQPQLNIDDTGMLVYHYEKNNKEANYLELRFCLSGNVYCQQKETECNNCKYSASRNCIERQESMDVLSFNFSPTNLSQFVKPRGDGQRIADDILNFSHFSSFLF